MNTNPSNIITECCANLKTLIDNLLRENRVQSSVIYAISSKSSKIDVFFYITVLLISVIYFSGLDDVPFHPDESTHIFMSADLSTLLSNPASVFWSPKDNYDLESTYRILDAPLNRYLIEIGRSIVGKPALSNDWDWSQSWEFNQKTGALPDNDLLLAARISTAILFPISLILSYKIGKMIGTGLTGWLTYLLFASNALVLLHTRRAMSEGILLFSILLFLYVLISHPSRSWLIGITAALAFCAKHTTAILFIPGMLSSLRINITSSGISNKNSPIIIYIASYFLMILALNPFLWRNPLSAVEAAVIARQQLGIRQTEAIEQIRPDLVLDTLTKKAAGLTAQLYLTPPDIADIGNYLNDTRSMEIAYSNNPLHNLFRGMIGGGIFLILTLAGFIIGLRTPINESNQAIFLVWIAGLFQLIFLILIIKLPFQRYYLPMTPFTSLWIAFGITGFTKEIVKRIKLTSNPDWNSEILNSL